MPGVLGIGDLPELAAALAPRPLLLDALVDGRNCPVPAADARRVFEPVLRAYRSTPGRLALAEPEVDAAAWLAKALGER